METLQVPGVETESVVSAPMASTARGVTRVLLLADAPVLRRGLVSMINETAGMQSVGTPGELRRALTLVETGPPRRRRGGAGLRPRRDPERLPRPAPPLPPGRHRRAGHLRGPGRGERGAGRRHPRLPDDQHLADAARLGDPGRPCRAGPWSTRRSAGSSRRRCRLAKPFTPEVPLTRRESDVLDELLQGQSNRQIGRNLFISEDTVKSHVKAILRKLGARDRAHAVSLVLSNRQPGCTCGHGLSACRRLARAATTPSWTPPTSDRAPRSSGNRAGLLRGGRPGVCVVGSLAMAVRTCRPLRARAHASPTTTAPTPSGTWSARCAAAGFSAVAGADEAGRGACAGPLVAAACVLPAGRRGRVPGAGRLQAADRGGPRAGLRRGGRPRAWPGRSSSSRWPTSTPAACTSPTSRRCAGPCRTLDPGPDYVLTDGFPVSRAWPSPALAVWKGDRVAACVAAASVLAKVTRDRMMLELHERWPEYDFAGHKGYITDVHSAALRAARALPGAPDALRQRAHRAGRARGAGSSR